MAGLTPSEVLVLIAAYEEESKIGAVVTGVCAKGFLVLVVDDGSKDWTAKIAREAGAEVFRSDVNEGKGASLRKGIELFLKGDRKALIFMDADGQHDPEDLPVFLKALDSARFSIVVGNRMGNPVGMPWIRRVTNRGMSSIVSRAAGQKITDSQCGYRALSRESLEKMTLKTSHFEIESEMLLQASRLGVIGNAPVHCVYGGEKSHIHPIRDTIRFFSFLFRYTSRSH